MDCNKVKLSASKKFAAQRKEVERLRKIESDLAGDKLLPKNADDFEKLLINSPDNGLLWLQYMSFFLQVSFLISYFTYFQNINILFIFKVWRDRYSSFNRTKSNREDQLSKRK